MKMIMLYSLMFLMLVTCVLAFGSRVIYIEDEVETINTTNISLWNITPDRTTIFTVNDTNVAIGTNDSRPEKLYVEGFNSYINVSDFRWGNGTENTNYGYEVYIEFLHVPDIAGLHWPGRRIDWNNPYNLPSSLEGFYGGQYYWPCDGDGLGGALSICGGGQINQFYSNNTGGQNLQIRTYPNQRLQENLIDLNRFYGNITMQDGGAGAGYLDFLTNNRGIIWQGGEVVDSYDGTNDRTITMTSYGANPVLKFSAQGYKGIGVNLSAGEHPRASIDVQRSGTGIGYYFEKSAYGMGSHEENYVCIKGYDADFSWSSRSQTGYICYTAGGGAGNPNHWIFANASDLVTAMIDVNGRAVFDHEGSYTRPTESLQAGRNFSVAENDLVVNNGRVGVNTRNPSVELEVVGAVNITDNTTIEGNIYLPYYNGTGLERGCILFGENRNTGICAEGPNFFSIIVNGVRVFFCQTGACQFAVDILATSTKTRNLGSFGRLFLKIFAFDLYVENQLGINAKVPEANLDVNGTTITRGNITYNDTFWDDLRLTIENLRVPVSNNPDWESYLAGQVLSFNDQAVQGNEEYVYFHIQMPHKWKEGSNIHHHIHWTGEDNTSCNTNWNLTCNWANINDTFNTNNFTVQATCANNADPHNHNYCDLGNFIGTGKTLSSMLMCGLRRASSEVADSCNGKDAYLHEFDVHYEIDSPGSSTETGK